MSSVIQSLLPAASSDSAQERKFGSLEGPALLSHRCDFKDPTGRAATASQAISSKGVNCSGAGQNGFSFLPLPEPHFSYFRINFSFSWLFSVHWPLELGFFDSWRSAQELILPLRKFTFWHLRGTVSSDRAAVLFCTWHQSSPVTFFPWNDSMKTVLLKLSSKERFKAATGMSEQAPGCQRSMQGMARGSGNFPLHSPRSWAVK